MENDLGVDIGYNGEDVVFKNLPLGTGGFSPLGGDLDGLSGDKAGYSVSVSSDGSIVAVGATDHDTNKGTVRVYQRYTNNTTAPIGWSQMGGDLDGLSGDNAGYSVSLSSDGLIVAVGANQHNGGNGTVRVYQRNESNNVAPIGWSQLGGDLDGLPNDNAGYSVSLSSDGSTVAIGAYAHNSNRGTVRVYQINADNNVAPIGWSQIGGDLDGEYADRAGYSVSLSSDGSTVAVGAYYHNVGNGTVRVYKRNADNNIVAPIGWSQLGGDLDGLSGDRAGSSVSLSSDGSIVAVGAYGHDSTKGTARVYQRDITNTAVAPIGWSQLGGDLDGLSGDYSGTSVSLSSDGSIVAVGAYYRGGK